MARFSTPLYNVTTADGQQLVVDVTNSISAGLKANGKLMLDIVPWMKNTGCRRVLDFGAGALRHCMPLLKKGFEVIAVEYERAYNRPTAGKRKAQAEKYPGFTKLLWPAEFLSSKVTYDVALLIYVTQVIPVKMERELIIKEIARRYAKNSPRRLYYAYRYGEGASIPDEMKYNDGWVRGVGQHGRTFYAEWNAADTHAFFLHSGYERVGAYGGEQGYIYHHKPGML